MRFLEPCQCAQTTINGNGCTERLILNLDHSGRPIINVKFTDRNRYYDAFDTYYRDGRADDMVRLIGEYVSGKLEKYLVILNK